MSKKIRQLITLLVVVVLIGAMTVAIALIPSGNDPDAGSSSSSSSNSSSKNEEAKYLYEYKDTDIALINLKNATGSYEFTTGYDEDSERVTYSITGYEGIDFFTTMCEKVAEFGQKLEVIREMGQQADLAQFGLSEDKAARFTVTYKDGTKQDILIGETLHSNEEQRYAVEAGKDEVFVVEANQLLDIKPETLLSSLLLSIQAVDSSDELWAPDFNLIRISGRDHKTPIVIRPVADLDVDISSHLYAADYYIDGKPTMPVLPEATSSYLLDMCLIQSTGVVKVNPTAADKAKYGLDNPIYLDVEVIALRDDDGKPKQIDKYRVMVGDINEKEGYAYAMTSERNVIYTIDSDCIKVLTMSAYDIRDTIMYMATITSVAQMTVEVDGKPYTFIRDRIPQETKDSSTGETTVTYEYETYYNNEKMAKFGTFYTQFLTVYAESAPTGKEVKGELLFKATLKHYDELDKDQTVVCVYACDDDRRVLYEVDGQIIGLAKKSWATKVMSDVDKLINGKDITLMF